MKQSESALEACCSNNVSVLLSSVIAVTAKLGCWGYFAWWLPGTRGGMLDTTLAVM